MIYNQPSRTLGVAISSSNHGRDGEIFVAAFSLDAKDSEYRRTKLNQRRRRENASKGLENMGTLFFKVDLEDYSFYGNSIHSEIANSFYKCINQYMQFDSTRLFFNTELRTNYREEVKIYLKRLLKLPYPMVSVQSITKKNSSKTLKTNNLLDHADYTSNFLFRQPEFDTSDPSRRAFPKKISFPFRF